MNEKESIMHNAESGEEIITKIIVTLRKQK